MADPKEIPKQDGWAEQERTYREASSSATPAQRLRRLQEMIAFANYIARRKQQPR